MVLRQCIKTRYQDKVLRQGINKTRYRNIIVQHSYWGEVLRSRTCFLTPLLRLSFLLSAILLLLLPPPPPPPGSEKNIVLQNVINKDH